jgi:hypothetical protein
MNKRKFNEEWANRKKYGYMMPLYESSLHFNFRTKNRLQFICTDEILKEISIRINNGIFEKCIKDKREKNIYEYSIYTSGHLKELLGHQEIDIIKVLMNKKDGTFITMYL